MTNRISVVMPLYNKRGTVVRALNSVLKQTVLPMEIVVVNDGSTDGSEQLVEKLDHSVIKIVHQPNGGVSVARNNGIAMAGGDWIAFLDADDEWLPEYLASMIKLYTTHPNCMVVASSYKLQDYKGLSKTIILNKIPFKGDYGILSNYFVVASCSHPPLWTSALLVKKEAIKQIGGFPVGIKAGEDLITWARLAVSFEIGYCTIPLSVFIQDAAHTYDARPNRIPEQPDYVAKELLHLLRLNNSINGLKQYIAHWHKMRGSIFLRLGMPIHAIREIIRSVKYNPLNIKIYSYLLLAFLPLKVRNKIFKKFGGS